MAKNKRERSKEMTRSITSADATKTRLIILAMTVLVAAMTVSAEAELLYQLDVTYTNGSIISGPLSFGLSALPTSVRATFILGPGQVVYPEPEDPSPPVIYFDEADALLGRLSFGDATWTQNDTRNDLEEFSMSYDGSINALTYRFSPITTQVVDGGISLNFPLTITGMDIASDQEFTYQYTKSTQTLTELPFIVVVDIKPGSCPNPLNTKSKGVLPVAILGTEGFDVSTIDPASVKLEGVSAIRSSLEDVAAPIDTQDDCDCTTEGPDDFVDMTLKFNTQDIVEALGENVSDGDTKTLTLTGLTWDGAELTGADCVLILNKEDKGNRAGRN